MVILVAPKRQYAVLCNLVLLKPVEYNIFSIIIITHEGRFDAAAGKDDTSSR